MAQPVGDRVRRADLPLAEIGNTSIEEPNPQSVQRIGGQSSAEVLVSQFGPRDLFGGDRARYSEQAVAQVGDPDRALRVFDDGTHGVPARHVTWPNEPIVLEITKPASRRDPDSRAGVLKKRVWTPSKELAVLVAVASAG